MIKLVQPQITDLKYRKKLLKDKKTMAFNKINGPASSSARSSPDLPYW